jgi:hypothetical protein
MGISETNVLVATLKGCLKLLRSEQHFQPVPFCKSMKPRVIMTSATAIVVSFAATSGWRRSFNPNWLICLGGSHDVAALLFPD